MLGSLLQKIKQPGYVAPLPNERGARDALPGVSGTLLGAVQKVSNGQTTGAPAPAPAKVWTGADVASLAAGYGLPAGWRPRGSVYGDPGASSGAGPEFVDPRGNKRNYTELLAELNKGAQATPPPAATAPAAPAAPAGPATPALDALTALTDKLKNGGTQPLQDFHPIENNSFTTGPIGTGAGDGIRPGYDRTQFPTTEAENAIYRGGSGANTGANQAADTLAANKTAEGRVAPPSAILMRDEDAIRKAQRQAQIKMRSRRGRASTIMSRGGL